MTEANPAMDQQKLQAKQAQTDNARISGLVRAGMMSASDLPRLKLALRRHAQVGDIARLPKQQRDVLARYYDSTSKAALGSQQSFQAVRRNIMAHVEHENGEVLTEAVAGFKDENNPPAMLILQRKGIRLFPDGRRVVMYQNKQLGLVITIPYAGTGNTPGEIIPGANVQMEEVEEIMESLEQVTAYAQQDNVTSHAKHFKFADGSKLKVSHGAAKAIHMVHGALNDENKKKFADMLTTPKGFEKAAHFALSKVEYTIGGK